MNSGTEIIAAEVFKMGIIKKIAADNDLGVNVSIKKLFFGVFIILKF